jgi:hypothetical protein
LTERGVSLMLMTEKQEPKKITSSKLIPHIPLPFKEVMADVLKVKPPEKEPKRKTSGSQIRGGRKHR